VIAGKKMLVLERRRREFEMNIATVLLAAVAAEGGKERSQQPQVTADTG
jgi:hypothetical protein